VKFKPSLLPSNDNAVLPFTVVVTGRLLAVVCVAAFFNPALLRHSLTAPVSSVMVLASFPSHQFAMPEMLAGLNPLALGLKSRLFIAMRVALSSGRLQAL
jgi:hypothetical protein